MQVVQTGSKPSLELWLSSLPPEARIDYKIERHDCEGGYAAIFVGTFAPSVSESRLVANLNKLGEVAVYLLNNSDLKTTNTELYYRLKDASVVLMNEGTKEGGMVGDMPYDRSFPGEEHFI